MNSRNSSPVDLKWRFVYRDYLYHPKKFPMDAGLFYNSTKQIDSSFSRHHLGINLQFVDAKWSKLDFHNLPKKVTNFIEAINQYLKNQKAVLLSYLLSRETDPRFGKIFISFNVKSSRDCNLIERQVTELAQKIISRNVKVKAVSFEDKKHILSNLLSFPTITEQYQIRTSSIMHCLRTKGFALDQETDIKFTIASHDEKVAQSIITLCNREKMFGYLPTHTAIKKCVCKTNNQEYYETYLTYHAPLHATPEIEHKLQLLHLRCSCYYLSWTALDPQIGAAIADKIVPHPERADFLPLFLETDNPLLITPKLLQFCVEEIQFYLNFFYNKMYRALLVIDQ